MKNGEKCVSLQKNKRPPFNIRATKSMNTKREEENINYNQLPATYEPDGAADFYEQLVAAGRSSSDVRTFYRSLAQTLRLAAEQKTAFHHLTLGGLFAKIDFLCKTYNLPWTLRHAVNTARIHCETTLLSKMQDETAVEVGSNDWRNDLRAVAEFISAVYGVPIPAELWTLGKTVKGEPEGKASGTGTGAPRTAPAWGDAVTSQGEGAAYLRVVAVRWEDKEMIVRSEAEEEIRVPLVTLTGDWSYLTKLLHEGAQLNLVRPRRKEDGALEPELIIYAPDYLVDVTAVAGCFEEYSHSPFLHLLQKVAPYKQSAPIMLGHLASQLLDDEVHGAQPSTEQFLHDNALTLLALEAEGELELDHFLEDAAKQLSHIRTALHEGLEQQVGNYDPQNVMLEPSFVCEMLGLQGRMDFLQLDHRVLIEQKAGKGAYNPGAPECLRQQPKHYVQMLLYMAILRYGFHRQYKANNGNLQAFLLYSRYEEALLGLGPAPRLLFEALRIRNGLVWYEEYYCKGGARLLEKMTADRLNQLQAHGPLWDRYQRPQLEALLQPVREASALERDYFFRMLQFVTQEHYVAKVGNNTAQSNCYASKWYLSQAEKHENGEIYDALILDSASPDTLTLRQMAEVDTSDARLEETLAPARTVAKVGTPRTAPSEAEEVAPGGDRGGGAWSGDSTNFRQGDVVIVYPYDRDAVPDCRRTMVHRGTLVEIGQNILKVKLRAPQTDAGIFSRDADRFWAIEHDSIESSFGGLYSGLHAFLCSPRQRRDLLMLQRAPRVSAKALRGDYGSFNDLAQRVKNADDLFLIIGPPGTGKTSYGMLYTLKEQLMESETNVLLLSYTNRAVDEICSKLVEEGIGFLRIGNPHNCDAAYHEYLLQNVEFETLDEMRDIIGRTRVFVGTTTTMSSHHALFMLKQFDLAIIDEASQILEPHLLGLLSEVHEGTPAIRKIVMIGDHKQLPAVVQQSAEQSGVTEASLRGIGLTDCRNSLFERLLKRYGQSPEVTYMLRHQGRMHRAIADFPSQVFYEGLLDVVPLPHQIEAGESRLVFIPAAAPEHSVNDKVNPVEAAIIADLVKRIASQEEDQEHLSVGVIVPYRNQIAAIRSLLPEALRGITIDTVERYQGSQRDHIIYGFTIQKRYQLAFLTNNVFEENGHVIDRKLNVAMTRARKHLYLVGNPTLLRQNQTFAHLLEHITKG